MTIAYNMSVLAVARGGSTPELPALLPGLKLWLDASDSASLVLSGNLVAEWHDKSGNEAHALQTNPGLQGTKATGRFAPGAISFMNNQGMTFPSVTLTSAATVFMVAYWIPTNAYRSIGLSAGPNLEQGVDEISILSTTSPSFPTTTGTMEIGDGGVRFVQSGPNVVPNGAGVFEYVVSPTTADCVVMRNGIDLTSVRTGVSWNMTLNRIAGQNVYLGNGSQLAEILIYQGELTEPQRNSLRTYLSNKWSVTF